MGLVESVNRIDRDFISERARREEERERVRLEKLKEKRKKEDKKQLERDLKNIIKTAFLLHAGESLERLKDCYTLAFYNRLLKNIFGSYTIEKNGLQIVLYKKDIAEIYDKNYYKILADVKKRLLLNQEALKKHNAITYSSIEEIAQYDYFKAKTQKKDRAEFWRNCCIN